jgi:hypothetical protein
MSAKQHSGHDEIKMFCLNKTSSDVSARTSVSLVKLLRRDGAPNLVRRLTHGELAD